MTRMESPDEQARITARVDAELKGDFKDACDNRGESMTEALESMMQDFVDEYGPLSVGEQGTGYYPDDETLRELYEICLKVAENGEHGPTVYQRRHASTIAQQSRQVSKPDLGDAMMRLRRAGYATIGPMPPNLRGESAERWRSWIIKPACADPEQWKYRENQ